MAVQVVVHERERQTEREQPVGPGLHLGQRRPQPDRGVRVEPARVTVGEGGVLLGPGGDVRRRLGGSEPAQARALEVREVRRDLALEKGTLAGHGAALVDGVTAGVREHRALVGREQEPAGGFHGRHRDHAVGQPGQHARRAASKS